MAYCSQKYLPCVDGQELDIHVWYNRDGRRGYYLTVNPVRRGNGMVSFSLFSGESKFIKAVARKSAKAEREAIEEAKGFEAELIAKVLEKNNLELATVAQ